MDNDAHVRAYAAYLWREYIEEKLARDNYQYWLTHQQPATTNSPS